MISKRELRKMQPGKWVTSEICANSDSCSQMTQDATLLRPEFKQRFLSWWHGYDPEAAPPPPPKDAKATPVKSKKPITITSYAQAVELVWPQGFCSPGEADDVIELAKPLRLTKDLSLLDLGAGFGGPARAMAKTFGVYITGMEVNRDFVDRGNAQTTAAGLAKHLTLAPFDPELFELPERKYDRVFSKEFMFNILDRPKFFTAIYKSLRPKGELLFTDYVCSDDSSAAAKINAWAAAESGKRYPVPFQKTVDDLKVQGFDVRIAEDMTEIFVGQILKNFQRLAADLPEQSREAQMDSHSLALVNKEVSVWLRRVELLQSHALRVYRFHAIRPESGKMMSNW